MSAGGVGGLSVTLTTPDNLLGGTVSHTHTHRNASTRSAVGRSAGVAVLCYLSLPSKYKLSEVGGGGAVSCADTGIRRWGGGAVSCAGCRHRRHSTGP